MNDRDLDRISFVTQHFADLQGLRFLVPLGLLALAGASSRVDLPLLPLRVALILGAFLLMLGATRYYRSTFGKIERQPVEPVSVPSSCSIYSPTGPPPRLRTFSLVTPGIHQLLILLGGAWTLYFILLGSSPAIMIVESQVSKPWVTLDALHIFEPHWGGGTPFSRGALFAQTIYVVCGALFLHLWLWRERRPSEKRHFDLAVLHLGLAAFGATLGHFVWADQALWVAILNLFLPALVQPGPALLLCGLSLILAGLLDHWQLVRTLKQPAAAGHV